MKEKISVIIPTYNSWKTLKVCIESVKNQTHKPFEIIVIDNASTDGTSKKVKKNFPKVKLVTMKSNSGVTGGRNMGIRTMSSKSQFAFFFDHDMIADEEMLSELLKVEKKSKKNGIITPKIYYKSDKNRIWSAGTEMNLKTGRVLFRGGQDEGQYQEDKEVQVAPAAMLVKKRVLDKIIGFDPKYFATYEDTDFCFRAKKEGFKTVYSHKSIAWHDLSTDPKDEADRLLGRAYYVAKNRILFMWDFGENKLLFSLFIPVYSLYYLNMAIRYKRLFSYLDYIRGTLSGLLNVTPIHRYIPLSFYFWHRILLRDIKAKSVLDVGCSNGAFMNLIKEKYWDIDAIDLSEEYAFYAKLSKNYNEVLLGDAVKTTKKLIDKGEKYDLVVCSHVIEHLDKKEGQKLLANMERLSRKATLVVTPIGYIEQPLNYTESESEFQEHKSGWEVHEFKDRGYLVRGLGLDFIWSENGIGRKDSVVSRYLGILVGYLLSPLAFYSPNYASSLIAILKK